MSMTDRPLPKMAFECQWLRRTIEPSRPDPYVMLCTHIVRDGQDCIGPFLEDMETNCGLWDPNDQARARAKRLAR
ncbi:MAG: hypothetical protein M0R73_09885 [Dehalococcoidia bacterium]|nr:hypothetical protein [Dehalococcoidia bacterium]